MVIGHPQGIHKSINRGGVRPFKRPKIATETLGGGPTTSHSELLTTSSSLVERHVEAVRVGWFDSALVGHKKETINYPASIGRLNLSIWERSNESKRNNKPRGPDNG
jgi:hypothetical protein